MEKKTASNQWRRLGRTALNRYCVRLEYVISFSHDLLQNCFERENFRIFSSFPFTLSTPLFIRDLVVIKIKKYFIFDLVQFNGQNSFNFYPPTAFLSFYGLFFPKSFSRLFVWQNPSCEETLTETRRCKIQTK